MFYVLREAFSEIKKSKVRYDSFVKNISFLRATYEKIKKYLPVFEEGSVVSYEKNTLILSSNHPKLSSMKNIKVLDLSLDKVCLELKSVLVYLFTSPSEIGYAEARVPNKMTEDHYSFRLYNKLLSGEKIGYYGWFALLVFWAYTGANYETMRDKLLKIPNFDEQKHKKYIERLISKKLTRVSKDFLKKHNL